MVLPQQKNPLGRLKLDSSNMFQSLETLSGSSPVPFNPTSQPKQMQIQNAPVDHRIQNSEMWIFYRKGVGDMMWVEKDDRVWVWPKVSRYSLLLSCPTSLKPHPPWLNLPQNLISLSDLPVWPPCLVLPQQLPYLKIASIKRLYMQEQKVTELWLIKVRISVWPTQRSYGTCLWIDQHT